MKLITNCLVHSEMITVLEKLENHQNHRNDLTKASERLGKVLIEADIRLLVKSMEQKNSANMYVLLDLYGVVGCFILCSLIVVYSFY